MTAALGMLADMGAAGWLLLVLLATLGGAIVAILVRVVLGLVAPDHGAHSDRVGLDVLTSPAPSPTIPIRPVAGRPPWEARAYLDAPTHDLWERQPGLDEFAAGAYRRPRSFDPGSSQALPVPGSLRGGPDEHGPGRSVPLASRPVRPPSPGAGVPNPPALRTGVSPHLAGAGIPAPVPEVAHDEYTGPGLSVSPALDGPGPVTPTDPGPAGPLPGQAVPSAGPVPHTAEDDALAAQVRAWCSEMDADTLNYLHDYAAELKAA